MKLIKGQKYNVTALQSKFVGWTKGDGSSTDGYQMADYFDADGTYRGADEAGIEPILRERGYGDLRNYVTGAYIRPATKEELRESLASGPEGVFELDGISVFVED